MTSLNSDRHLAILRMIQAAGQVTRRDIADRMGLSLSIISRLTADLLERQLLSDNGKLQSRGGRPSDLLNLNVTAGYVIGLDLGSTHQGAVVADLAGGSVATLVEPTELSSDREVIVRNIERLIERAIAEAGVPRTTILGIGLGLQAIVDPAAGVVRGWPNTPAWSDVWMDFPIRDVLAARLPWSLLVIEDTVRAMAIAEAAHGAGTSNEDFVYILDRTGIGAALMLNGAPYLGSNHVAGEIGHVRLTNAQIPCKCGNVGCLETLASSPAILAHTYQRLGESQILSSLRSFGTRLTIADVIAEAERGDKLAYQVLTEAGEYLGKGLAILLNLLGPRLIVIGGQLAASTVVLDAARRMMKFTALTQAAQDVVIKQSQLNDFAGAHGAAAIALSRLFSSQEPNILTLLKKT